MTVFRAISASGQSVPGSTDTPVVFGTEVFDPDGVFAANQFTVPVGMNGEYFCLDAGFSRTSTGGAHIRIQRDGADLAFQGVFGDGATVSTGPVLLSTGEVYRVVYNGDAVTLDAGETVFFTGHSAGAKVFRARSAATQSPTTNVATPVIFGTEIFDPDGVFAANQFTVPAGWDGLYGFLYAGVGNTGVVITGRPAIEVSTDSGSSWDAVGVNFNRILTAAAVQSGRVLFNAGDIYRVTFQASSSTIQNTDLTFFAGFAQE